MKKETELKGHLIPHYKERHVDVLPITPEELRSIGTSAAHTTLFFSLFGVALGSLGTMLLSLATGSIGNQYVSKAFWLATIISGFAALYFGTEGWRAWSTNKELIKTIEKQCGGDEPATARHPLNTHSASSSS